MNSRPDLPLHVFSLVKKKKLSLRCCVITRIDTVTRFCAQNRHNGDLLEHKGISFRTVGCLFKLRRALTGV
jgi:hypothetical protein